MSYPTPHSSAQGRSCLGERRPAGFYVGSAILLLLAVSTLAFWLFTGAAVAEEAAPDAPGSILGTVKTTTGEPRAEIAVTLYQLDSYNATLWRTLRTVTTQADGRYRFNLLPTGLYRIGANDPQRVYAPTYYPAAPVIYQGDDIAVTGSQRDNIDLILPLAGQITGVVTLSDGLTMTYGIAELRQQIVRDTGATWEVVQTTPLVASQGVYSFTGLAAAPYRVCATVAYQTLAATECYNNVYDINAATSLTLTAGATISNVNLLLGDGADFGQLSGQVTSPANAPLAKIDVYALQLPPTAPTVRPLPTAVPGAPPFAADTLYIPNPLYYAQSDETGRYHFSALAAGNYWLYFSDPAGNYAFEYYTDAQLPEMANLLTIAKKEVRTDVDIQLEPASHLRGLLTVLGQPAPEASVTVEMKSGLGWRPVTSALVNSTGVYTIDGLPAGSYRVNAYTYISDGYTSYFYTGYAGGSTLATATTIELTVGITKSADITLTGGPRFEGTISGQVTANGQPLAGAKVMLYPGGFPCCSSSVPPPIVYVVTDADGHYTMQGLAENVYSLGAADPSGRYATTYYTDQKFPSLANTLYIADNEPHTTINIDLPTGGAISGQVTQRDGAPVVGLRVILYAPSPFNAPSTSIPIFGVPQPVSTDMKTDSTGRYTIQGLHAGAYYLCFRDMYNNQECYGAPLAGAYDGIQGTLIQVQPGVTKTKIDLLWGPDLTYYLPTIAR